MELEIPVDDNDAADPATPLLVVGAAALFIAIADARTTVATDEAVTGVTSDTTTRSECVPESVALLSAGPGSGLDGNKADKLDEDTFDFLITSPTRGESAIGPKIELSVAQRR